MIQAAIVEQAGSLDASFLDAFQGLPLAAHSVAIAGLVGGLLVWAFGRRMIRSGFAMLGMIVGGGIGFVVLASVTIAQLQTLPVPEPYIGLAAGALAGLIVSIVLFRFVMAASTAIVMAIMGVLACAIYLDVRLDAPSAALTAQEMRLEGPAEVQRFSVDPLLSMTAPPDAEQPALAAREAPGPEAENDARRLTRTATMKIQRFMLALHGELNALWDRLPEQSQLVISLSAALGAAVGALSGLMAPRRAAGAITAMLGAAVWIPCAVWLAHYAQVPGLELLRHGPVGWMVIWLGAAALGIVIQWGAIRTKPAEQSDDEE